MQEWQGRYRVAMFTNVYLPVINGVVVSVELFRKALTSLNHHVYVFGPDSGSIEDRAPYIFRYPTLELPLQKYPLTLPVSPYIDHVLRNLKPQILHANHPALLGRVAERKSVELGLPLVFTYHTRYSDYSHYVEPLPQENIKEFIEHWLASFMSACHQVIVPSKSIKDMLLNTYGDAIASYISIVPTGVETARFAGYDYLEARAKLNWPLEQKVLISVGRLAKEKSFDRLLRAFALIDDKKCSLVIVGGGDEKKPLEKLAKELGLGERVKFTGWVTSAELPIYLAAADVFVFASLTETQGLVTLEAMAAGLPIVAVDASGTRDAVVDSCALLTADTDLALAKGIDEMMSCSDLGRVREAAKKRAGEFDVMSQARALVEVYGRAIEAHKASSRVLILSKNKENRWKELLAIFRL